MTYNNSVFATTIMFAGGATLTAGTDYSLSYKKVVDGTATALSAAPKDAGSYRLVVTGIGDYRGTQEFAFTINRADAAVSTAPEANTLTYTGSAQALVTEGSGTGGTMNYAVTDSTATTAPTGESDYTTDIPKATDAGSYRVWYKVAGDGNHNDSAPAKVDVDIAPKPVTLTANSGTETYDGTEKTVTGFTAKAGETTVTATFAETVTAGGSGTNAGKYDVTFSGVTVNETKDITGNYVVTGTTNGTLTVAGAVLTVTANDKTIAYGDAPADDGVRYDGFVNSENESVLNGTLAYAYTYERYGDVGSYTITPSGLTADNYEITLAPAR